MHSQSNEIKKSMLVVLKVLTFVLVVAIVSEVRLYAYSKQAKSRVQSSIVRVLDITDKVGLTTDVGSVYILSSYTGNLYTKNTEYITRVRVLVDRSKIADEVQYKHKLQALSSKQGVRLFFLDPVYDWSSDFADVPNISGFWVCEFIWDERVLNLTEWLEWYDSF